MNYMDQERSEKMELASFDQSFQHPEPPDLSHSFFASPSVGLLGKDLLHWEAVMVDFVATQRCARFL